MYQDGEDGCFRLPCLILPEEECRKLLNQWDGPLLQENRKENSKILCLIWIFTIFHYIFNISLLYFCYIFDTFSLYYISYYIFTIINFIFTIFSTYFHYIFIIFFIPHRCIDWFSFIFNIKINIRRCILWGTPHFKWHKTVQYTGNGRHTWLTIL